MFHFFQNTWYSMSLFGRNYHELGKIKINPGKLYGPYSIVIFRDWACKTRAFELEMIFHYLATQKWKHFGDEAMKMGQITGKLSHSENLGRW
jgi:hypothetical protein